VVKGGADVKPKLASVNQVRFPSRRSPAAAAVGVRA
jgi:hypothetical protein